LPLPLSPVQRSSATAQDLETRGEIDLSECFIDGTFVVAKKGGKELVRLSGARHETHGGGRQCFFSSRHLRRESAAPHEVRLVEQTLQASFVSRQPNRLIGDKAYDSDPLDAELKEQGIEM
jgi:hypothetical protein